MADELDIGRDMRDQCSVRRAEGALAELAGRQFGVVSYAQLHAAGFDKHAISRRIAARRLNPLYRGVYAVGHPNVSREGRWMAAVLAGGHGCVLSHRSAAALWGIRPYDGPPEVTVSMPRRKHETIRHHASRLAPDEVTTCRAIPATTPARTLLDLAAVLPAPAVEAAIREAEFLRIFDLTALQVLLNRHSRRRGMAQLRVALARAATPTGRTRSELEARFKALLSEANLPAPEVNATLVLHDATFEADFLWRSRRLIVELDGFQAHGTRSAFERDRERDRRLAAAGYRVIRVTWRHMTAQTPALLRDLAALAAEAP